MSNSEPDSEQVSRGRIVGETAKIEWRELMREFAGGRTLLIEVGLDMVEVAFQLEQDNSELFAEWLQTERVRAVSDDEAQQWHQDGRVVWACVVRPWVLVQIAVEKEA